MRIRSASMADLPIGAVRLPQSRARLSLLANLALLATAIDLLVAFPYWALRGVTPAQVLRSIAAWVLGPQPPQGVLVMVVGVAVLIVIYLVVATAFDRLLPSRRLHGQPWFLAGCIYGVISYVVVFQLLVPAVVFPVAVPRDGYWLAICLLVHALIIGPMMAWGLSGWRGLGDRG